LELADDFVLMADERGVVHGRLLDGDAGKLAVADAREGIGGGNQRFGGDASPIEASAAELLFFDNGDGGAELGGADGGGITTGTGADDCEIKVFHREFLSVFAGLG